MAYANVRSQWLMLIYVLKVVVLLLLIVAPFVGFCVCSNIIVLLCTVLCPFKFCNPLDEENRAGCFTLFFFMASCDCYLQCVIVVFPDHTQLLFLRSCHIIINVNI